MAEAYSEPASGLFQHAVRQAAGKPMTHQQRFDYLRAEHTQLLEAYFALLAEHGRMTKTSAGVVRYRAKLLEHRLLVANHRFARQWVFSSGMNLQTR